MPEEYETLPRDTPATIEIEIQRSKFLAFAARADTETAARAVIDSQKRLYPDARHHCSAYTYLPPQANPVRRSSDDGEPSGTAGRPMLEVLVGTGLQNVAVVVTRYFGGIKLGTGGLVRAYSGAVAEVLAAASRVQVTTRPVVSFEVALTQAPAVEAWLRGRGVKPLGIDWSQQATFRLVLPDEDKSSLEAALSSQLGTAMTLNFVGSETVEVTV